MLLDLGREELLVRPLGLRDRLLVTREKRCEVRLERWIEVAVGIVEGSVRHLPSPWPWATAARASPPPFEHVFATETRVVPRAFSSRGSAARSSACPSWRSSTRARDRSTTCRARFSSSRPEQGGLDAGADFDDAARGHPYWLTLVIFEP